MGLLSSIRTLRDYFFRRSSVEREMDEEFRSHIAIRAADLERQGLSRAEAERQARIEFGGYENYKEECREALGTRLLQELVQDVRYGLRQLRRNPGFTVVVVLIMALGIGTNTSIFSLINAVWFQPLPVHDPSGLVVFKWTAHNRPDAHWEYSFSACPGDLPGRHGCTFPYPMLGQVRSLTNVFSKVVAMGGAPRLALTGNGPASTVRASIVSGNFFRGLGIHAAVGRTLQGGDSSKDAPLVAVLSHRYWENAFGGDPSVLGKTVRLNKVPLTIVGVISSEFQGIEPGISRDIWVPLRASPYPEDAWFGSFEGHPKSYETPDVWWVYILARLKPGVSLAKAQAAASVVFRNEVFHGPKTLFKTKDAPRLVLMRAPEGVIGARELLSLPLTILAIAAGIVLLIACANTAGIMLARTEAREREIAVRLAMGGSRLRIARQLMTEGLLLSAVGGLAGILFAAASTHSLAALVIRRESFRFPEHLDARVLAFCVVISVLCGAFSGLVPASSGTRNALAHQLKDIANSRKPIPGTFGRFFSLGNGVVVVQVSLSLLLLVGTGLLVHTLTNLENIDPGFDTRKVLLFSLDPAQSGYTEAQTKEFYSELRSRLSGLPGVSSASYSLFPLLGNGSESGSFEAKDAGRNTRGETEWLPIGPRFFETMRIALLAGRTLDSHDFVQPVPLEPVNVNQAFVHGFLRCENPLGVRLTGQNGKQYQIVGVVADAVYRSLRSGIKPTVYIPQRGMRATFAIRTSDAPLGLVPTVRRVVSDLDSNIPVLAVRTETEHIRHLLFRERMIARLASFFSLLALLLACVGLYGLLSYEVTRRTHEIGIRIALGAEGRDVLKMVVGQGLKLVLVGVAIGIVGALALTRFLASLLYGVKPTDPITFIAVSLILIAVALLACYIPARRAARVDPMVALRYE